MQAILFIALVGLTLGGGPLQAQVGESCQKDSIFVIDSFNVNPWPIQPAQQYTISIGGKFSDKDYIEQIYIAQKQDRGFWHYTYQTIQKEYAKNSIANFTISLQGPSEKSAYTDQITFHRHDFSSLACWQFSYDIK
jgi:hypothetical protein